VFAVEARIRFLLIFRHQWEKSFLSRLNAHRRLTVPPAADDFKGLIIMKYEVVYVSKTGNTEKAAYALAGMLPDGQTKITPFPKETPSMDADVYLIGFGVYRGSCPFELLDFISALSGKTILLFGSAGISAAESFKRQIESSVLAFLPDDCEYLGLHLIPGKYSKAGLDYFYSFFHAEDHPEFVQKLYHLYEEAQHHPNDGDMQRLCRWAKERLL